MWPCCGTAVFALAGWRFPTRCHTRLARAQLLSCVGPFDCAWGRCLLRARMLSWYDVYMRPCCHLGTSRKGQQNNKGLWEDNKRIKRGPEDKKTKDEKSTTGGQGEDKSITTGEDWRLASSRTKLEEGQEDDNNKTKGGHRVHRPG